jgi:hypothetical protein
LNELRFKVRITRDFKALAIGEGGAEVFIFLMIYHHLIINKLDKHR